jgi:AraC-like DNA-binding protein
MHKAIEMLEEEGMTRAEIASQAGYESEAALSKAFKKWNGQGAGGFRRSTLSVRRSGK